MAAGPGLSDRFFLVDAGEAAVPIEVKVGGATVFVVDVERFERL